jgi:hypothetical protein
VIELYLLEHAVKGTLIEMLLLRHAFTQLSYDRTLILVASYLVSCASNNALQVSIR